MELSPITGKKQGVLSFTAGSISTDTGAVLLRELDRKLGITASFAVLLKEKTAVGHSAIHRHAMRNTFSEPL